jgi:hypothetical protein
MGSCFEDLELEAWNQYLDKSWDCNSYRDDQVQMEEGALDDTEPGDSGALYFTEDPDNQGNWYAIGSHNGLYRVDTIYEKAWVARASRSTTCGVVGGSSEPVTFSTGSV